MRLGSCPNCVAGHLTQMRSLTRLSTKQGEIEVQVIDQNPQMGQNAYSLMWWRDALALPQ